MKLVIMFAATAVSAGLVLPTVSQGQSESVHKAAVAAAEVAKTTPRRA